jgi:diguanylate cyclase (GGDEF)-like protein
VKSIRSNILAFAILATLVPSVGLGLMSFVGYQDVINRNVDYELKALAKDASAELAVWVRERAYDLRTLSTASTLVEGLTGGAPRPGAARIGEAELALYLRSVQKKLDPLLELTLRDTSGRPVASSAPTPSAAELPSTWPATALSTGAVVVPPQWDETRATPTMAIAVPVLSLRNELVGALVGVVDLRAAEPRLRASLGASPAEVVVIARDGTPLVSTRGAAATLPALSAEALTRLRSDLGTPVAFSDFHNQEVLGVAVATTIPALVLAERERAEVFGAWLDHVRTYVILVVSLILLVAFVAYWLGRAIVTPLTALTAAANRVAAGDLGVTLHDASQDEIGQLTRAFTSMTERVRASQREVESANEVLRAQNDELEKLATTDSLTGLFNRKKLEAILRQRFAVWQREGTPFALLMVELDNLDRINADYGMAAGDEVLVTLSAMLRQSVSEEDSVARFGGDRFVVVASGIPFDAAMEMAERIRRLVESPEFGGTARTMLTTASVGVVQTREGDADATSVMFRADHALHAARGAGGNRVQSAM